MSVSLHCQRCDNFCHIQRENTKWIWAVIICGTSLLFASLGPTLKACTTFLWGPKGCVLCKVDGVGPVDLAHCEKCPLHQRHLKKRNCWLLDLYVLVSPVAGVTALAHIQNLPHPQSFCHLGPLLHNSCCPKLVQVSNLGTGTWLSYLHALQTAYLGTNIWSGLLLCNWNRWSCSKMPYISAVSGLTLYKPVFLNQTSVAIVTPSGAHQWGISFSAYMLEEAWHRSTASKWKTGMKGPVYLWYFIK